MYLNRKSHLIAHHNVSDTARAPRFLLNQESHVHPEQHYLYHHQQKMQPAHFHTTYPNPPTITLLPLRPRTCLPRTKRREAAPTEPVISDMFDTSQVSTSSTALPV